MRILFDFELYNNRDEDGILVYIMDGFKKAILQTVKPYMKEIADDGGNIVVTIRPDEFSILYIYNKSWDVFNKVQPLLSNINWGNILYDTALKLSSFREN
jgi:hypothetical protein